MKRINIDFTNEYLRLILLLVGVLFIGALLFITNNITGFFNAFIFLIQIFVGVIFGIWYLRLFFVYVVELRNKNHEKKVGVQKGWAIFGLIVTLTNFIVWVLLSNLIFNFPKILFIVPVSLAMIQIIYIFVKSNRRSNRDWLILFYNIFVFLYLFVWTLIDFGVDLPSIFGIVGHTTTSTAMWWQLIFLNTGAFFAPTFVFPPYLLNPRYYFAMPVEQYYEMESKRAKNDESTKQELDEEKLEQEEITTTKLLPGERVPFYEERRKEKEMAEEVILIRKERYRNEKDIEFAEFIGSNDISFTYQKFVAKFDSFLRLLSTSIILILIVLTPVMFAGNISMNISPNYTKLDYSIKSDMVVAVSGSVFSSIDSFGNISIFWEDNLEKEINWSKELHATHIRYDLKTTTINNSKTKSHLDLGLNQITSQGLKLILSVSGQFASKKQEYINAIYRDAIILATDYKPDYMIILNEINSEVLINVNELIQYDEWLPVIANISTIVKSISPQTKIVTTVLATEDGFEIFSKLFNSTLNIDVIGVSFYPIFFGWRYQILQQFSEIFHQKKTTEKFWISETGMESFNFGENAQAKYLAQVLSDATDGDSLNADGVCIKSLIDNEGFTVERGIISHFGLIYYNGNKKKAFSAVKYALESILSI